MRGMPRVLLPACLLAAGCAAEPAATPGEPGDSAAAGRLPPMLRLLTLNEDHPTATPVEFDHAFHAAPGGAGIASCSFCHHETRETPAAVPRPCGACHAHNFLAPDHDEAAPHDHAGPPDLCTAVHRACRSCHAAPDAPDPALPRSDCAFCHRPSVSPPSLRPLFPVDTVSLEVAFGPGFPEGRGETWAAALREGLLPAGVRTVPRGTPGAPPVEVKVTLERERGETEAGGPFAATRVRAVLVVNRARVEVACRPVTGEDGARRLEDALADLLRRVVVALSL